MPSNDSRKSERRPLARATLRSAACALVCGLLGGCGRIENQWVDDGPSRSMPADSPSAQDLRENQEPSQLRVRDAFPQYTLSSERGEVQHGPLYFEDPFEDKGSGHGDYRHGWEDLVAAPYGISRFTLNWLLLPASMVVTPPWTTMESDGILSEQALGYDHDAERAPASQPAP